MPRVSVIIPTYRRPVLLRAAIQSVLNQTFQDFEIVVVDDASGDDTADVVESFGDPRLRYLVHGRNLRVGAARNTGLLNSTGSIVAFLDDDDEWYPEKLGAQVAILEASARTVGVVYTAFAKVDRGTGHVTSVVRPAFRGHILHELCRQNCVGTASTVALRRECFDEVGLFDESIDFGEEYDMWIRIAHQYDFAFLPEPLVRYSVHRYRLSMSAPTMIRGVERQIEKHKRFFAAAPRSLSRRYASLGSLYCTVGDTARARYAFEKAISVWPWSARYYGYLALVQFGTGLFTRLRGDSSLLASVAPGEFSRDLQVPAVSGRK